MWSRSRGSAPAIPLTWPVTEEMREQIHVRWPTTVNPGTNLDVCLGQIKRGISAHVAIEHADIPQPRGGVMLFHVVRDGAALRVVIDTDDRTALNASAATSDLYFKMQYLRGGYGNPHIRPGGYVCLQPALYRYRANWRALRAATDPTHELYGRFGASGEKQDVRADALALLAAQDRFEFYGGASAVWWGEYMDEMCNARVCLDLPGRGELCYRLIEYLAVGACVIGPELEAELHVPLESGTHLVRTPRNLDGLVDQCGRLVHDPARTTLIGRGAADYFDRYLSLEQLGAYYVDTIWRTLQER
jgi:hypothetical protein